MPLTSMNLFPSYEDQLRASSLMSGLSDVSKSDVDSLLYDLGSVQTILSNLTTSKSSVISAKASDLYSDYKRLNEKALDWGTGVSKPSDDGMSLAKQAMAKIKSQVSSLSDDQYNYEQGRQTPSADDVMGPPAPPAKAASDSTVKKSAPASATDTTSTQSKYGPYKEGYKAPQKSADTSSPSQYGPYKSGYKLPGSDAPGILDIFSSTPPADTTKKDTGSGTDTTKKDAAKKKSKDSSKPSDDKPSGDASSWFDSITKFLQVAPSAASQAYALKTSMSSKKKTDKKDSGAKDAGSRNTGGGGGGGPDFWDKYKWWIVGGGAALLVLGLGATVALKSRSVAKNPRRRKKSRK